MSLLKGTKKKLKKTSGGGSGHGGGGSSETSDLRPVYVPKTPPCISACPNATDIRGVLTTIQVAEKEKKPRAEAFAKAWEIFAERNPFPSVCGRVCPHPCEVACNRQYVEEPVHINGVERFIGDYALQMKLPVPMATDEKHDDLKIAVIGAGPAGLSCAYQMARNGFPVTVFEAFSKAGGMLRWGIPPYRLPDSVIDAEIQRIVDLGVELKLSTIIGKDISYDDLTRDYKAVFVALGAHVGRKLGLEGEDKAANVMTGAEFLNRINSREGVDVGGKVVVIGGGNSAIDAARVSKRLGAEVTLLYRRTRNEMPAIEEEIVEAEKEGINFEFLAAPISFTFDDNGNATGMVCQRMELGEPDDSGRRRPVPIEGDTFETPATFVIPSISQEPNFENLDKLREGRDWVKIDGRYHIINSEAAAWAGGDNVNPDLVTTAIGHGRFAATAMIDFLLGKTEETAFDPDRGPEVSAKDNIYFYTEFWEKAERHNTPHLPVEERFDSGSIEKEVTSTLSEDDLVAEAMRCMSCGMCFKCDNCYKYCQDNAVVKPLDLTQPYRFKLEVCQGCKKCAENCPCGYIDMV